MNDNKNNGATISLSLPTVLTIVFVILKLTKVVNWSWWWVLSPLWISVILSVVLIIIVLVIAVAIENHQD